MENSATAEGRAPEPDLSTPPRGVRVSRNLLGGTDFIYRRINPVVFFLLPFTALWSGLSLGGIYGSQLKNRDFDPVMSLAGIPFVLGTLLLIGVMAFMFAGSWRVRLERGRLTLFVGIGPVGRRRGITIDSKTRVELLDGYVKVRRIPRQVIMIKTGERAVSYGAGLPPEVRLYLAAFLSKSVETA